MRYAKSESKGASRDTFRGVWSTLTTPFTTSGQPCEHGLRRNVRNIVDGLHVQGLMASGAMGEFYALSHEEWKRVISITCSEVRGKCGVIANTGAHSVEETIDLTRHASDAG